MAERERCPICLALPGAPIPDAGYPPPRTENEHARRDRIRGVFFGGAVGDAIGTAVKDPGASALAGGLWPTRTSGATQLALFTAEGVLRRMIRGHAKGIWPSYGVVLHAYHRWLFTQGKLDPEIRTWASPSDWPDGWLVRQHLLHGRRTDHPTTVRAITGLTPNLDGPNLVDGEFVRRPNHSDSAGALIRVAPAATILPAGMAFETGAWSAAYTHGGPLGLFLPGVLARMITSLVAGSTLDVALHDARRDLLDWRHHGRALAVLDQVIASDSGIAHAPGVERAFVHGVEATRRAMALADTPAEVLQATAFEHGRYAAIIAGQLVGAQWGDGALPAGFRSAIDIAEVVERLADACAFASLVFALDRSIPELERIPDADDDAHPICDYLWQRFPGW